MIFDTDILIWVQKGNKKTARVIDQNQERKISILTCMELLQSPSSKEIQRITKGFLADFNFEILPISKNIGHRAAVYIEEHSLSTVIRAGDAIIAATAVKNNFQLLTGNKKYFRAIAGLNLKIFWP